MVQTERDKIITELFTSKELSQCISKIDPAHLRDDLKSEVFLVLCELPADRIVSMHSEGRLGYYALRTVINMSHSNTSPFFKMYRADYSRQSKEYLRYLSNTTKSRYDHILINEVEVKISEYLSRAEDLSDPHWFDAGVTKVYLQAGSIRTASERVGIPRMAIQRSVNRAIKHIKCSR